MARRLGEGAHDPYFVELELGIIVSIDDNGVPQAHNASHTIVERDFAYDVALAYARSLRVQLRAVEAWTREVERQRRLDKGIV